MDVQAPQSQRQDDPQAGVEQRPGDQVGADLPRDLVEQRAGGAGIVRRPGEEPHHLGREHLALDQEEDHEHHHDEALDHPGGEVGQAVAQLVDQERAVGVAEPVDGPRLGEHGAEVRLVADQLADPAAHLAGETLDIGGQRVGRPHQALGHQARQVQAADDHQQEQDQGADRAIRQVRAHQPGQRREDAGQHQRHGDRHQDRLEQR